MDEDYTLRPYDWQAEMGSPATTNAFWKFGFRRPTLTLSHPPHPAGDEPPTKREDRKPRLLRRARKRREKREKRGGGCPGPAYNIVCGLRGSWGPGGGGGRWTGGGHMGVDANQFRCSELLLSTKTRRLRCSLVNKNVSCLIYIIIYV